MGAGRRVDVARRYKQVQERTATISGHLLPFPANQNRIRPSYLQGRAIKSAVLGERKEAVTFNCCCRGWSVMQASVQPAPTQELIVRALFFDHTLIEHHYTV